MFACWHFECSRLGRIPMTASFAPENLDSKWLTVSRMVFAMILACLPLPFSRLLVPPRSNNLLILEGRPPFWVLHSMFSIRSPPIAKLVHSLQYSWRMGEKDGREKRSKMESPNKQIFGDGSLHNDVWSANFSPQDNEGFDMFRLWGFLGMGSMDDMT